MARARAGSLCAQIIFGRGSGEDPFCLAGLAGQGRHCEPVFLAVFSRSVLIEVGQTRPVTASDYSYLPASLGRMRFTSCCLLVLVNFILQSCLPTMRFIQKGECIRLAANLLDRILCTGASLLRAGNPPQSWHELLENKPRSRVREEENLGAHLASVAEAGNEPGKKGLHRCRLQS